MDAKLAEAINQTIKNYQVVLGCSVAECVLVLDYLHAFYLQQGLKEINTTEEEK